MKPVTIYLIFIWISFSIPAHAELNALSSKKGACITTKKGNKEKWNGRVASLNVSWHYSWGSRINVPEPKGVEFVPMIYGFWGVDEGFKKNIRELAAAHTSRKRYHLLGFNEPDHKNQSNMSVEKALRVWPYLEKTGLRLGSPAAVHADKVWMQQFMAGAKNEGHRVDFVTVHWYGSPTPDSLVNHLKKIHKMYGKPIWITEFAVADWNAQNVESNRHSVGEIQRFMREVLPRLDKLDFVERYAWFSGGQNSGPLGTSSLFKSDGSLTWLGKTYAAHQ